MKFTIDRNKFLKMLNTVSIAIEQKSPSPIYLNYKLDLDEKGLTVISTNGNLTIQTFLPYQDGDNIYISDYEEGVTLIQAKFLLEIVKRLESDTVTVDIIDEVIVDISDNYSKFRLNALKAEDYPQVDFELKGQIVEMEGETFKNIINQTSFAAATKENARQTLLGINMTSHGNEIDFTAADNSRLARKTYHSDKEYDFSVTVPSKTITEVAKLIDGGKITLSIEENKIIFSYGDTKIYSRLIEGKYEFTKKYGNIAPNYVLQAKSDLLISAIQKATLFAIEKINVVTLAVSEDECHLSSSTVQVGSADISLSEYRYKGNYFEIHFNSSFVLDAIKACQSEDVVLTFAGEAGLFKVSNPNDEDLLLLVTPVQTYSY